MFDPQVLWVSLKYGFSLFSFHKMKMFHVLEQCPTFSSTHFWKEFHLCRKYVSDLSTALSRIKSKKKKFFLVEKNSSRLKLIYYGTCGNKYDQGHLQPAFLLRQITYKCFCYRNRFPANEHHQDFGTNWIKSQNFKKSNVLHLSLCRNVHRAGALYALLSLLMDCTASSMKCSGSNNLHAFAYDSTCRWTPELRLNGMCADRLNNHK